MNLSNLIDRFSSHGNPLPAVDLSANEAQRRALLARAQHATPFPVTDRLPPSHADEAARFASTMEKRYGIEIALDHKSIDIVDAFFDAARSTRPEILTDRLLHLAGSWLGECTRLLHSFNWSEDDILTDGRIAYDPYTIVQERAASPIAPTLLDSIRHAVNLATIEVMRAG